VNADWQFHGKFCMSGIAQALYMHINLNASAFIENSLCMKASQSTKQPAITSLISK
jgi:hypothetical protein